jgi:serine/threonine protein phosphatase PrpC
MNLHAHGLTDIGKERNSNADFFTIRHFFRRDKDILAISIADGMGDRPHSETAGRMFCERSVALAGEEEIFAVYDRHQDRKLRNMALRSCLDAALQAGQEIYRRSIGE